MGVYPERRNGVATGRWRVEAVRKGERTVKCTDSRREAETMDRALKNGTWVELPKQPEVRTVDDLDRRAEALDRRAEALDRRTEALDRRLEALETMGLALALGFDSSEISQPLTNWSEEPGAEGVELRSLTSTPLDHEDREHAGRRAWGTRFHELSVEDQKALSKVIRIVEAFRDVEGRMPTSYADAFLRVAAKPGHGPSEYSKDMGTTQPVASRLLLEIGSVESGAKSRHRERGLELVDRQVSDMSLRNHEYFLTPKGLRLVNKLISIINS
jgi:hypothetical protein